MKRKSYFFLLLVLVHCKAFINLKVPPITITNAQTAAEKQMVGEDRELEKDGWLLSSIQSSSNGSQSASREIKIPGGKDSLEYGHYQRLIYYTPEIKKYKIHGVVGEGIGGILKWNPEASSSAFYEIYKDPEKKKRILEILSLANESRKVVIERQLEEEKKKGSSEEAIASLRKTLTDSFQRNVGKGEYYESKSGKWERLP